MEVNKETHNAKVYCARFPKGNIKTQPGRRPLAPNRDEAGKHKKPAT
jgi:hypothetical protein